MTVTLTPINVKRYCAIWTERANHFDVNDSMLRTTKGAPKWTKATTRYVFPNTYTLSFKPYEWITDEERSAWRMHVSFYTVIQRMIDAGAIDKHYLISLADTEGYGLAHLYAADYEPNETIDCTVVCKEEAVAYKKLSAEDKRRAATNKREENAKRLINVLFKTGIEQILADNKMYLDISDYNNNIEIGFEDEQEAANFFRAAVQEKVNALLSPLNITADPIKERSKKITWWRCLQIKPDGIQALVEGEQDASNED